MPVLFEPGLVSTGDSESHATLSPDGRSLLFVKLTPDFAHWTVVTSERADRGWSEPAVAWFSGRWDDADVSFSPDGTTLYFISNRPEDGEGNARADTDLFRIRRRVGGWGPVERIAELSSPGNEWFPNQSANGTLYFGSERREGNFGPAGTADLWRARWLGERFAPPENLGSRINTAGEDIEPWVAPDESYLVFASKGRADSLGSYDRGHQGYGQLLERLRAPGNGLFDVHSIATDALGLASPCPSQSMATSPARGRQLPMEVP